MASGQDKNNLIRHLQAFRGFAIVCVVALHAWGDQIAYFGGATHSLGVAVFDAFNETLLHDSTTYFALISGLLFAVALRSRGWLTFFRGRVLNVVSPYIVVSIFFTLWNHFDQYHPTAPSGRAGDYVAAILANLLNGSAYYHLWYIPIVIVLSVLTPLTSWLCDRPRWHWLLWLIMLVPLVASRTALTLSWRSVAYFLGSYCAGMFIGSRYGVALDFLRRYRWAMLIVAGLSTAALLDMYHLGIEWLGFVSVRESMFYIQKLALAAVVIVWFHANEVRLPQWLMTVGTYAFPIFFVHAFVLTLLARAQASVGLVPAGVPGMMAAGALLLMASIWFAVLLTLLARRVFGKYSRSVIGA